MLRINVVDGGLRFSLSRFLDDLRCQMIDALACLKIALKGIAHDEACRLVNPNSSAALSTEPTSSVLHRHELLREATLGKVKVQAIHRDQLWKQHIRCLFLAAQAISKDKAPLL